MKKRAFTLMIVLVGLTSCQSIPAERKNNCACLWEAVPVLSEGAVS